MPDISIIVPCFNQAHYLDECLQSVLDQTYQNWECIIVNDGSPDNTEEVAKRWVEKDSRFKYLYEQNSGVCAARNYGISNAIGEWILPLDGDDKIHKNYLLEAQKNFRDAIDIIYCRSEYFGDIEEPFCLPDFDFKEFLICNQIFCSAFFRKSDWEKIGGFDLRFVHGYEDWDFWITLLENSDHRSVLRLDFVGFYYRIKDKSRNSGLVNNILHIRSTYDLLYAKHKKTYDQYFGNYLELVIENKELRKSFDALFRKTRFFRTLKSVFKL